MPRDGGSAMCWVDACVPATRLNIDRWPPAAQQICSDDAPTGMLVYIRDIAEYLLSVISIDDDWYTTYQDMSRTSFTWVLFYNSVINLVMHACHSGFVAHNNFFPELNFVGDSLCTRLNASIQRSGFPTSVVSNNCDARHLVSSPC